MIKKYLENGIGVFEKHEILEMLLFNIFTRCNTNDISHRLLNEFKSIKNILNANINDLMAIEGIGRTAASYIRFLGDFFRYLSLEESNAVVLDSSQRVFEYCLDVKNVSSNEFFLILFLDKKQALVSKFFVDGQFDSVYVNRRDIVERALVPTCVGAVAVHSHPDGFPEPSSADIAVTRNLRRFLGNLGVNLHDHLIICDNSFLSMRKSAKFRKIWL